MLEKLHHLNSMLVICITRKKERKVHLRKDLHPIGEKRCLPLAVWKLLNHQPIPSRIHLRSSSRDLYEQELQLSAEEISPIERVPKKKNQVFVKWKGYSDVFNLRVPLTDLEARVSIWYMPSSWLKTVMKTMLSFLKIYEDWLLERVDVVNYSDL